MGKPEESEESIEEMIARTEAGSREYNCERLMGALHLAPKFAPYFRAVLIALPRNVTEKLIELEAMFLAVEKSIDGLVLDLPPIIHAHPTSDSRPGLHTHTGRKILYFSPLLFEESQEYIRFTIAHEIAHAVLGHTEDFVQNAREIAGRQERESDVMAEQWGFKRPSTVPPA